MGLHKEEPEEIEDPRKQLVSFNEKDTVILFDVAKHEYTYNGKVLKSATSFIKDFEEQFDAERMSASCAGKWGVGQEELLAMWNSNGEVAAGFGTAVHAVMEHFFTYKKLGATVQTAAGKDKNAAMPNHPFLQSLINSLELVRLDGEAYQEACISCVKKGICGLVDDLFIVDRKKKICRIRDYKITFNILVDKKEMKAPFAYLGKNKLAKNFLQLSFYGYLMTLSGWTVEGIDIFNWTGEWKKYTLEGKDLTKTMVLIGSKYV